MTYSPKDENACPNHMRAKSLLTNNRRKVASSFARAHSPAGYDNLRAYRAKYMSNCRVRFSANSPIGALIVSF
jgi:hypothetical protein